MAVCFVYPHRRDVHDVVACDETEREEATNEELGSNRDGCSRGKDDYPPPVVKRGGEPRHVFDHVLRLREAG